MLISAARTVTDPHQPPAPATLHIEGAFIEAIAPHSTGDADVVLSDRYVVVPAMINTHTHLAMVALRGIGGLAALGGNVVEELYFQIERHMNADDVRAFARIGAYECLLSGTGMVWDHYYFAPAIAEAIHDVGLCGAIAPTLQDLDGPGVGMLQQSMDDMDRIAAMNVPGIAPVLGPHATDTVSDSLWTWIRGQARKTNVPIHTHLAQSADEVQRSWQRHGCGPLERLRRLGLLSDGPAILCAHGLYLTDDERSPLAAENAVLAYCPAAQSQFDFPASIKEWRAAGGDVALGTDAGSCNDTIDVQAELRLAATAAGFSLTTTPQRRAFATDGNPQTLAALVTKRQDIHQQQLSPPELLKMVWQVPGALHPQLPAGLLSKGYLANVAIYDTWHPAMWPGTDPLQALVYGQCSGALHGLILQGQWIGERGMFQASLLNSDTYRQAVEDGARHLQALLRRAGLSG